MGTQMQSSLTTRPRTVFSIEPLGASKKYTSLINLFAMCQNHEVMKIRQIIESDIEAIVELGSRAWMPLHRSIEEAYSSEIYSVWTQDPDEEQRNAIRTVCTSSDFEVSVALLDDVIVGFIATDFSGAPEMAEVHMIAVDPSSQRQGVAEALMTNAEAVAVDRGVKLLMVETGSDHGHAPARSLYSSTGFRNVPVARFFKRIS
jgi:ribosomal protein S18 acetylase RimI-like enzyme